MQNHHGGAHPEIRDYGAQPFIFNLHHAVSMNRNFRTTLWTGEHLQLTLMCIPSGGDIGLEMHENVDQFIRIESGNAKIYLGSCRGNLREAACVDGNYALLIPAGTWHNVVNVGRCPLKLYSIYAPVQHPAGTVHKTKADAQHQ